MPQYRYEVKRGPGKAVTGVLEAESQHSAVSRLREMGYFPISVEEESGVVAHPAAGRVFRKIRLTDRNIFFRQLANLTESGMPITRALATIEQQTENARLKHIVERLRQDVQKGSTFAEALERHPRVFTTMQCNLVRAGEAGGMLEEVLWRIVVFGEQEEELKGKAVTALIYPTFLFVVGTAAIFILVSFVFPKFIAIFEDFDAPMPLPTRVVMAFCGFMGTWWWAVSMTVILAVGAVMAGLRSSRGRALADRWLLRMPVVGKVCQRYEMARFARTLGTLLDNGVPILTALRTTRDTLGNSAITAEVDAVYARVSEGDSISESLRDSVHFPPMVVSMFAVGEESGRLGAVTRRIAEAYDNEVDRAVKALTALLEPVMIVIMGIIIGFLVIAMLLPMLTLSATVA